MNILAIGNSFSQDATRYLHQIARAAGYELSVVNLYIGGCSLERHHTNMLEDKKAYEVFCNGYNTNFYVTLKEALLSRAWDVITLQQVSVQSPKPETYHPYIEELAAYVRERCPKAKLYIHQTWGYENGSKGLIEDMRYDCFDSMQNDIVTAYQAAAESIKADGIIRSGEMFAALLHAGVPSVHRDTCHASRGLGRYALGLLWYQTLTKGAVAKNRFTDFDEPISRKELRLVKRVVSGFAEP